MGSPTAACCESSSCSTGPTTSPTAAPSGGSPTKPVEKFLAEKRGPGARHVEVVFVPVGREQILDALVAGRGAGPARIAWLRRETTEMGLDPNRWFGNVELVAAKRIGRETVNYVSNIYKYYVTCQLVVAETEWQSSAAGQSTQK
jgi:hypothetical protein